VETLPPDRWPEHVSNELGGDARTAREILRTVLALLAQRLDETHRDVIQRRLPRDLRGIMAEPGLVDGVPPARGEATGPQPTALDRKRAHTHSVIERANPHGERKISSGHDEPRIRGRILSEDAPEGDRAVDFDPTKR